MLNKNVNSVKRVGNYIVVAFFGIVMFFSCKGNDPTDNQYDIELAKLQAMYPGFRIALEDAKTKPRNYTDAFNETFNENGGLIAAQTKKTDDSIKAAIPTAQMFLDASEQTGKDYNKANMLVLKSTAEQAKEQGELVQSLFGKQK